MKVSKGVLKGKLLSFPSPPHYPRDNLTFWTRAQFVDAISTSGPVQVVVGDFLLRLDAELLANASAAKAAFHEMVVGRPRIIAMCGLVALSAEPCEVGLFRAAALRFRQSVETARPRQRNTKLGIWKTYFSLLYTHV